MQVATYIQDLLYRYECVILPGFGAFLTQYHSAGYDAERATWYPPGKSITFNKQLQTNDGLLANYVATVKKCTYEEALATIRNYTGTLATQLRDEKQVTIEHIGHFSETETRQIVFEPQQGTNFYTESFGLSSVSGPVIKRSTATIAEEETAILFTPLSRERFPYLKYAAVGIIALMLAGAGGLQWRDYSITNHNETQKQVANELVIDELQAATFEFPSPLPAVNVVIPKEQGRYHIVGGAFRVQENAQKKLNQLAEKGFNAKYIGTNKYGLHQVVYASYSSRSEALQSLRTIKRTENSAAWLLVKQLD